MVFHKIEIEGFRGIRHALVNGFKQVNLFFGKNNCGKSSLLDALFLVSGLSNPSLPLQVNFVRGYGKTDLNDLRFLFYNLDADNLICIKADGRQQRDVTISLFETERDKVFVGADKETVLSNIGRGLYGLRLNSTIDSKSLSAEVIFDDNSKKITSSSTLQDYEETLHCSYLEPKYNFTASIRGLANIVRNKDEHFIVDGLKLIEPRVIDFAFTDGELFVDIGLGKRIPINMMGDGTRKIVSLLTAVYECKDGVLLVDEISNGFHYSVMTGVWSVLIDAANRNNTQLFVTTHDIDSIKGLRNAAMVGACAESVAAFKLLKTENDELKSYHYSVDSLDYAINQEIELR